MWLDFRLSKNEKKFENDQDFDVYYLCVLYSIVHDLKQAYDLDLDHSSFF